MNRGKTGQELGGKGHHVLLRATVWSEVSMGMQGGNLGEMGVGDLGEKWHLSCNTVNLVGQGWE